MGVAALGAAVQQAQIRQRRRGRLGRDLAGIDQGDIAAHEIADHLFQQRIVGAAQDQGVDPGILYLLQILGDDELGDGVAVVHIAVFHQRHEHGAGAGDDLRLRLHVLDDRRVGTAAHRGRRADDAHLAVAGGIHRRTGRGTHHAGKRHRQTGGFLGRVGGGHCAAGSNNELYIVGKQKADVLPGILADDLPPAGAVGHAAGITKINDVLAGQHAAQLAHGGQAAQTAVKHSDGAGVHQYAPFRRCRASCSRRSTSWA